MQDKKPRKWRLFRRRAIAEQNPDSLPTQKTAALNGQETGLIWIPFEYDGVTLYRLGRENG